ncbi:MAG: ATP-binding cassette domain-containing protein [Oscillospiraceae bacterium]|nr:ATP-binding cassette domain-containing protein [Oscillospiraceae bacterium]
MLETKNLCKTYQPKKGVPVKAVDNVSLRFPEKGMVFLLGKSGSGKSTMLNLLGGLDQYDGGEIIIKGISSKDFNQQRFDSYRNTYVGFIFQEYNVLEEFTVGANIALALELQGRKATDEELNQILHAVDLDGYGNRKPNELSGGQKQRVAIARALVKNPEIIMADEPTGALDSNTGRQVLDTLKNLSKDKLVILVSHDREYAEQYADRIIEMADGQVIRDVEAVQSPEEQTEKKLIFRSTSIEIPADYHLTEEDRIQINQYLDELKTNASLMLPEKSQKFRETDQDAIPIQDGSKFNLIKSKLPMKSAFKIGKSSLKHKKFRLVTTILLSVTAFTTFALVDTFSSYNHIRTCTDSLVDSDISYISVNKAIKRGRGLNEWWDTSSEHISYQDLKDIREETGLPVSGIFIPTDADMSFNEQYDSSYEFSKGDYTTHLQHFCGYAEISEATLDELGFRLIGGNLPDGSKKEIAISAALADTFVQAGYYPPLKENESAIERHKRKQGLQKISSPVGMVGKTLRIMDTDYTISGVVDTRFDLHRYDTLLEDSNQNTTSDSILEYLLYEEYSISVNYSLTGCALLGEGALQPIIDDNPKMYRTGSTDYSIQLEWDVDAEAYGNCYAEYLTYLKDMPEEDIVWLTEPKTELKENEVIISFDNMYISSMQEKTSNEMDAFKNDIINNKIELNAENLQKYLDYADGQKWQSCIYDFSANSGVYEPDTTDVTIVGCVNPKSRYSNTCVLADSECDKYIVDKEGIFDSAVGPMPDNRSDIETIVRWCYRNGEDVENRFALNNAITYELDSINSVLKVLSKVFLYIGLAFAIFASLLMANFITTSIHYKRQEIGILRAIGSRSADVFRIFFSESFIIAIINFVCSAIICGTGVFLFNYIIRRNAGVLITVLHFGIRQIILLLFISVFIAAAASFFPVRKIASKRPIDAIRDK